MEYTGIYWKWVWSECTFFGKSVSRKLWDFGEFCLWWEKRHFPSINKCTSRTGFYSSIWDPLLCYILKVEQLHRRELLVFDQFCSVSEVPSPPNTSSFSRGFRIFILSMLILGTSLPIIELNPLSNILEWEEATGCSVLGLFSSNWNTLPVLNTCLFKMRNYNFS